MKTVDLKYTVGDKSQGLLSTTIDKTSGGLLKGEEAQLKCSPEYEEGAIINLTLVQLAFKHDEKAISDKITTEKADSGLVEKTATENVAIAKSTAENVAVQEVAVKTNSSATTITAKQVDLTVLSNSF